MKIPFFTRSLIQACRIGRTEKESPVPEAAQAWAPDLLRAAQRLGTLEERTERDFLQIGERLQDFHQRSQDMADMASRVLGLMSGEAFHQSMDSLQDIIGELGRHLDSSREHSDRTSRMLGQYHETLRSVSSSLEDFRQLVLNLRMLGFLTRVENAHLFTDDSGFSSLTDDVKKLSESVREKSSDIRHQSDSLLGMIRQTLSEVSASQQAQRAETDLMLRHMETNRRILGERTEKAMASARLIARSTGGIAESIGDIVSGMQFHDITRQQISHVREALETVVSEVQAAGKPPEQLAGITAETCSLQVLQLGQSEDDFLGAVENIRSGLEAISRSVEEIMHEANEVAWASDSRGRSFMEEIDGGISTVITALDHTIEEHSRLTATVKSVSDMVSDMSSFVREIEGMGLNLQLIALNARIRAAHIGNQGAALDTISGSIYDLSKNSRSDTLVLSGSLSEMGQAARAFDTDLEAIRHDQREQMENLLESLKHVMNSLREVNSQVLAITTDMNHEGKSLAEDIRDLIGGITVDREVSGDLTEVRDALDRVRDDIALAFPDYDKHSEGMHLEALDRRYTMESERNIHFKHLDRRAEEGPENTGPSPGSDLGDNVELF
jgi:methyl-accepting chemotaxis protein